MKIYLDCCCFNRPFDDLRQDRVRIEADAMAAIFARLESGEWQLIAGEVLFFELSRIPNELRRVSCLAMAEKASRRIRSTLDVKQEADRLASLGIAPLDAAHIASAKAGQSEVFLTVDDSLLRRARRIGNTIGIPVRDPVTWLLELETGDVP